MAPPSSTPNGQRIALVTGASRGIGRAVATALGTRTCRVYINYAKNQAAAKETCAAIVADGGEAETLDLTLSWRAGRHAAEHRVLVGDEAAVEDGSAETVTTTEKNLADDFRQRGFDFEAVIFEDTASVYGAYFDGRCDVTTSDKSQLAAIRAGADDPSAHIILAPTISKEPLTPAVPHGDDQWLDLVKLVMFGLINAEELGVTQSNVDEQMASDQIPVRRLLGEEGDWGYSDLGLSPDALANAIKAVGNYGEMFDTNVGKASPLGMNRGLNSLWKKGGILYAPPMW